MTQMLSVKRSYMHTCHFISLNNLFLFIDLTARKYKKKNIITKNILEIKH